MILARLAVSASLFVASLFVVNLFVASLLAAALAPAAAVEKDRCLTPEERRAKVAAHAVVPLTKAIRAVKARRAEVVRASLCDHGGRLVYVLTVLSRDGKVARARVDAGNGAVIVGR